MHGYFGIRINDIVISENQNIRFGWCGVKNMPLSFHKTKRLEIRVNIKSKSMTLECSIDTKARDDIQKGRDIKISNIKTCQI